MSTKKKVMVIDEDQAVCNMIAGTMKYLGHEVYTETQHPGSIDRAVEIIPDLIFVSLLFNATNGLKVSRSIHSKEILKKVPLVMLTSSKGELDPKYTRTIGVVDILVKPLSERDIIAKTEDILGAAAPRLADGETNSEIQVDAEIGNAVPDEECLESRDTGSDLKRKSQDKKVEPFYEYGFNPMIDDLSEELMDEENDSELNRKEAGSGQYNFEEQMAESGLPHHSGKVSQGKKMKLIAAALAAICILSAGVYWGLKVSGSGMSKMALSGDEPVQITEDLQYGEEGFSSLKTSVNFKHELVEVPDEFSPAENIEMTALAGEEDRASDLELTAGKFSAQIGFYGYRGNAEALVEKMKQRGYAAFVAAAGAVEGRGSYRVLVGSFDTRKEALKQSEVIFRNEGIKAVPFQNNPGG
jgi:DNA-binding response OmpR family regulator